MATTSEQQPTDSRLGSLLNYILRLYLVGGIPLVLIGLGAVNQFVPWYGGGDGYKQLVVTITLFVIGVLTWSASTYLAIQKWKVEMVIATKQDEIVLTAICEWAKDPELTPEGLRSKTKTLMESLVGLGVRSVGQGALPPATH